MSYSLKIELQPHADEAKTVTVYSRTASGARQIAAFLHETTPVAHVSVAPGTVLEIVDNVLGMPPGAKDPFISR